MTLLLFLLAVVAILATPGPTNTLLCAAGGLVGVSRALPLIAAEIGGYLISITVLRLGGDSLVATVPAIGIILRVALLGYLLLLACRLWTGTSDGTSERVRVVTFRRVFVTTLLNPKALIFAFVIFPQFHDAEAALPYVASFTLTVVAAATGWILFGSAVGRVGGRLAPVLIPRVAAVALTIFAGVMVGSAITAKF